MIYSYRGISKSELDKPRLTSDGRQYSLNHDKALVIDMRYKGREYRLLIRKVGKEIVVIILRSYLVAILNFLVRRI